MKVKIGITEAHLKNGISMLSSALANQMTLYVKLRKFHWNVYGPSFMEFHLLFEGQYKKLEKAIDETAERIGKLGGKTIGTLKEFADLTVIKESPNEYPEQKDMLKELIADHETMIVQMRKDVDSSEEDNKDTGTADFLTRLMLDHETMAWKLRRYLE
ncbi:starvation-inducible DNA-binding protein [Flavobacterium micromati]|jgi:starvation-inducible DNA-binding protein|uniref:Starvation-inducible DNA-binding protein n=1 Tax=Flavobacterium micromati TaxID=229205 RepID=A0A1M5I0X9_9FLAO|nr:DNA starvation/stationary phase protection protein [Flavobacterium micromati]SHG21938.1 starvation-inducible DNA-binding protein [Flavobacterium micromati]